MKDIGFEDFKSLSCRADVSTKNIKVLSKINIGWRMRKNRPKYRFLLENVKIQMKLRFFGEKIEKSILVVVLNE